MHTVDTIMSKLATFRVHIAPLGFEIDRIMVPVKETRSDKLWLLIHEKAAEDKSGPYLEKIKKEYKKLKIELKIAYADRLSLFKAIKTIKGIIEEEKGNYIYVNVDAKYQNFTCYMHSKEKSINGKSIDFQSAISEMLQLDWNYSPNYIGFTNENTQENVQFCYVGPDKWYAEILIKNNGKWEGYVLCCYDKFEKIKHMLSLFFEELEWTRVLPWKLKRIGKYARD